MEKSPRILRVRPQLPIPELTSEQIERFWSLVDKRGENDCWEWLGNRLVPYAGREQGYGRFQIEGHIFRANRIAYTITNGPIPDGFLACHTCDNPPCCNPKHLWAGTYMDNLEDRRRKGRSPMGVKNGACKHPETRPRGEASGKARATEAVVRELRRLRHVEGIPFSVLAKRFGLSESAVGSIIHRQTWKHVV